MPGIVLGHDVRGRRALDPVSVGEGTARFELSHDLASGIYFATFQGPGAPGPWGTQALDRRQVPA